MKGWDIFDYKLRVLLRKYGGRETSITSRRAPSIASFQHGVLQSRLTWMFAEASLRTWMPAILAGITKCAFHSLWAGVRS